MGRKRSIEEAVGNDDETDKGNTRVTRRSGPSPGPSASPAPSPVAAAAAVAAVAADDEDDTGHEDSNDKRAVTIWACTSW
jgi:hypothetical protein